MSHCLLAKSVLIKIEEKVLNGLGLYTSYLETAPVSVNNIFNGQNKYFSQNIEKRKKVQKLTIYEIGSLYPGKLYRYRLMSSVVLFLKQYLLFVIVCRTLNNENNQFFRTCFHGNR